MPALVTSEEFEDRYTAKFKERFAGRGVAINYVRDRAALDIGFHLTAAPGKLELSGVRVWFQLKGKYATTFTQEHARAAELVPVSLRLDHLRFWYASGEATYLIVYLESIDDFVAQDVRDLVDSVWGPSFLAPATFSEDQKSVAVNVDPAALLTDSTLDRMLSHRTMRIDGPSYNGRPLGHRLDPLRSQLGELSSEVFEALVKDLLAAHDYQVEENLDPGLLVAGVGGDGHVVTLTTGILHHTWEWVFQMGTEFGYSAPGAFRSEGQRFYAQGKVAILIHSGINGPLSAAATAEATVAELKQRGIEHLLLFGNAPDQQLMSFTYRQAGGDLLAAPQGLGSLTFNFLLASLIYLDYRDKIKWSTANYLV